MASTFVVIGKVSNLLMWLSSHLNTLIYIYIYIRIASKLIQIESHLVFLFNSYDFQTKNQTKLYCQYYYFVQTSMMLCVALVMTYLVKEFFFIIKISFDLFLFIEHAYRSSTSLINICNKAKTKLLSASSFSPLLPLSLSQFP